MPEWIVCQWGDGSQNGTNKWNIAVLEREIHVATDLSKEEADFLAECHNNDLAGFKAILCQVLDCYVARKPTSTHVIQRAIRIANWMET